jgi:C4-dicarboxylate-specific signal transduction histidine kinase
MTNTFPFLDRTPRILVVDDQAQNRKLLWAILVPEGYEVIEADNGLEALDIIAKGDIDVVLLDVLMPGVDGIETCRRIRNDLRLVTLPIIFVTALSDRLSRVRGQSVGGDDFLSKPIDEVELLVRVKNLLRVKAYHDLERQHASRLENEVDTLREQLTRVERLATLGTLAGGVGHELNNLLTLFQASLHYLRNEQATGVPPSARALEQLQRVGEHMETHATHLLSLARPGPDKPEHMDLGALLQSTVSMLKTAGRMRHATITVHLPTDPVIAYANRTRLEQVFVNLILNAADAVSERSDSSDIDVTLTQSRARATIRVKDTGCGVPEELVDQIFDPYVSTKPSDVGTGLGLSVVRRIMEKLGGRVWVEHTNANGSTFAIEFPTAVRQQDSSSSEPQH